MIQIFYVNCKVEGAEREDYKKNKQTNAQVTKNLKTKQITQYTIMNKEKIKMKETK